MSENPVGVSREITPPASSHVAALDGLRGLAILMVLGHHLLNPHAELGPVHLWLRAFVDSLWMGVDLFFVLSGFLITGILVEALGSEHYFRNFYMRRVLRIFPLYYFTILVFIVCAPFLHIVWGHQLVHLLTYTNRIFIDPHHPGWNFYFGGLNNFVNFWSLAVEEQFYFVWPLLIFLFKRPRPLIGVAAVLAIASIAGRIYLVSRHTASDVIYTSLACRADALLIGGILALAVHLGYRTHIFRVARLVAVLGIVPLAFAFVHSKGIHYMTPFMMRLGYTVDALLFASLVALALNSAGLVSSIFSARWLRFFGRYSYGLYILHSVLPAFYAERMGAWITLNIANPTVRNGLMSLGEFSVSLVAALISYHLLEKPFLRLKRFFPGATRETRKEPVPAYTG